MSDSKTLFKHCLYFTANNLARIITRLADQEFRITGLSPSHAFVLMLVNENPGIGPKELADNLQLAPSTITRFIDYLEHREFLKRKLEGKITRIFPTEIGNNLQKVITTAWKNLYQRYSEILGEEYGKSLAGMIYDTGKRLES